MIDTTQFEYGTRACYANENGIYPDPAILFYIQPPRPPTHQSAKNLVNGKDPARRGSAGNQQMPTKEGVYVHPTFPRAPCNLASCINGSNALPNDPHVNAMLEIYARRDFPSFE